MVAEIALCYGTRPQVIKASVLRRELGRAFSVVAVDTGQHYDYELNAQLYQQLGVALPDAMLDVGSGSHAEQTAAILTRIDNLFRQRRPRAVVVIGDTNSTLGCALAAAKMRIPVVHVEAGLRANDALMAEELNRRAVDALASVLCTPSRTATERVQAERPDALIVETGDVSYDVLLGQLDRLPDVCSLLPSDLEAPYRFATLHRAELTDAPDLLIAVLEALRGLDQPTVLALHPRTRSVLDQLGFSVPADDRLKLLPAVGYLESVALIRGASAVITDSGGVQREAYWLGIPCTTIRTETEWPETVIAGANRLVPPHAVAQLLAEILREREAARAAGISWARGAYGSGQAGVEVARVVESWLATA